MRQQQLQLPDAPRIALTDAERDWWARRKSGRAPKLPRSPIWSEWVPRDESRREAMIVGQAVGPMIRMSAESFTAAMLSAGGSELQAFYLAHDAAQFRILGTGVSSWTDQKSTKHAVQATGARQPAMQATGASNGRGAVRCGRVAATWLDVPEVFVVAKGERWCLWTVGRLYTAPPVALGRIHEFSRGGSDWAGLNFNTTPAYQFNAHYDNGGTGAFDTAAPAYNTTNPFSAAVAFSSPHRYYLNGSWNDMAQTPGISSRTDGGNDHLTFGVSNIFNSGYVDVDFWFTAVFKLSGTEVPSGFAAMSTLARAYYAEPGL